MIIRDKMGMGFHGRGLFEANQRFLQVFLVELSAEYLGNRGFSRFDYL